MDFRRLTESNPEENCEYHNKQRLRAFAKESKRQVVAFDAVHENISHEDEMKLDDTKFRALPKRVDPGEDAPILIIHNISPEHALINQ